MNKYIKIKFLSEAAMDTYMSHPILSENSKFEGDRELALDADYAAKFTKFLQHSDLSESVEYSMQEPAPKKKASNKQAIVKEGIIDFKKNLDYMSTGRLGLADPMSFNINDPEVVGVDGCACLSQVFDEFSALCKDVKIQKNVSFLEDLRENMATIRRIREMCEMIEAFEADIDAAPMFKELLSGAIVASDKVSGHNLSHELPYTISPEIEADIAGTFEKIKPIGAALSKVLRTSPIDESVAMMKLGDFEKKLGKPFSVSPKNSSDTVAAFLNSVASRLVMVNKSLKGQKSLSPESASRVRLDLAELMNDLTLAYQISARLRQLGKQKK